MGAFVTNYAEVRRIKCEFSVAVHKKKGKVAEGWVLAADDKKKQSYRERGHRQSGHVWTGDRQKWRSGWPYPR